MASDWSQHCRAMPLDELRSTVSDGCAVLPSIAESEDISERAAALMVTVATSVLVGRLEADGRHSEALAVLDQYGGTR